MFTNQAQKRFSVERHRLIIPAARATTENCELGKRQPQPFRCDCGGQFGSRSNRIGKERTRWHSNPGTNAVAESTKSSRLFPVRLARTASPIGYTFTIEGKPAESVLRFQDGLYIPRARRRARATKLLVPPAPRPRPMALLPRRRSQQLVITLRRSLQRLGTKSSAKPLTMSAAPSRGLTNIGSASSGPSRRRASTRLPPHPSATDLLQPSNRRSSSPAPETSKAIRGSNPAAPSSRLAPLPSLRKRQAHTRPAPIPPDPALRQMRRLTRRGFATGAIVALTGAAGWGWLRSRAPADGIPWPLRRMLEWNQSVAQGYFRPTRLAPTFATTSARMPRVNGHVGLDGHFDPKTWSLHVNNTTGATPLQLSLADIKTLPRVDMITELKCIEGWSDPVHWTGARLVDLAAKFGMATRSGRSSILSELSPRCFGT